MKRERGLNDSIRIERETRDQVKYKCEKCGMIFGTSLGDMELHKTIVHLQNDGVIVD